MSDYSASESISSAPTDFVPLEDIRIKISKQRVQKGRQLAPALLTGELEDLDLSQRYSGGEGAYLRQP